MKDDLLIRIGAKTDDYFKQLRKVNDKTRDLTDGLMKVGQVSGVAFAALSVNVGIAAKKFIDFDAGMRNFNTIAKLNNVQFEDMNKKVLELSKTYPQTASTLTEGLYQVVSAGISAGDSMGVLEAASLAATAGLSNTNTSVQAIAGTLNAYGFEASEAGRVSDIMFKTVERGMITFPQLASSIGTVNAIASTAGVKFEEVSAAMATLTKNGIEASNSSTFLRGLMLSLIKPSDKLKEVYKKLGYESGSAALGQKGLQGVLKDITGEVGTSADALSKVILETRAFTAAAVLGGKGAKDFGDDIEAMGDSAGAAQEAFEEQSKSLQIQIDAMKSSVDALYIGIGKNLTPIIKAGAKFIREMADSLSEADDATGGYASKLLFAATAIAGVTSAASFGAVGMIKLKGAVKASTFATKNLSVALKLVPFVAVAAGIAMAVNALADWGLKSAIAKGKQDDYKYSTKGMIETTKNLIAEKKRVVATLKEGSNEWIKQTAVLEEQEKKLIGLTASEKIHSESKKEIIKKEKKDKENADKDKADAEKAAADAKAAAAAKEAGELVAIESDKKDLLNEIADNQELTRIERRQYANALEIEDETELAEKILDIKEELADKEEDLEKKKIQMVAKAMGITGDILGSVASLVGDASKEQFDISKALNLAQATMNTAGAVVNALNSPSPLAIPMSIAAGLAGAVQIATIASTSFSPAAEGSSGGYGSMMDTSPRLVSNREIIVPPKFSEGIRKGELSLSGGGNGGGGNTIVNVNVKEYIGTEQNAKRLTEIIRNGIQRGTIKAGALTGATS